MNICLLGIKGLAAKLGKKGTSTDITLYNIKNQGRIFNFVEPTLYPDKITSLLVSAQMSDFAIVHVSTEIMNFQLGEIILVLDYLKKTKGIVVLDNVVKEQLDAFIKGTVVDNYDFVENDLNKVWEKIFNFSEEKPADGGVFVTVDHSFQVKSVGLVILGMVKKGAVSKHDKLRVYPQNEEIIVKSIQMMDEDVASAKTGDRIGFALKTNVDVKRGDVIAAEGIVKISNEINVSFSKNKYFRDEVPKSMMVSIGLQYAQCFFNGKTIKLEKPLVYMDGGRIVLCDPSSKMRIVGGGVCEN